MKDLYSHSLLRSMACCRGESSTSAFGGDWLPSAISEPDSGAAAPAAFLPAASAAALSCCGEGLVPFLPFPASLQAPKRAKWDLWINLSYIAACVPRRVASRRIASKRGPFQRRLPIGVSIGSPDPPSSRHVFVADDGMTDQSTLNRTTFSSKSIGSDFALFVSEDADLHRVRNISDNIELYLHREFVSGVCVHTHTNIYIYIFKLE